MTLLRGGLRAVLRQAAPARPSKPEHRGLVVPRLCPGASTTTPYSPSCARLSWSPVRLFSQAASKSACQRWLPLRSPSPTTSAASLRPLRLAPGTQPHPSHAQSRTLFSSSVTTEYVNLPPNYNDADGLPFRQRGNLQPKEVAEVFGPGMSPDAANTLLRILHGRRVAGTLEDPAFRINTARFPQSEVDTALEYLRRTTPVDELINAGLHAEDELAAMEREQAEWFEKRGLEAPEASAGAEESGGHEAQRLTPTESKWRSRFYRETPKDDVYGVGAFDIIRARNRAKNEIRERKLQEAEEARRAAQEKEWAEIAAKSRDLVGPGGSLTTTIRGVPREMSPRVQQYALSAISSLEAPPTMSRWQRLWPSYATVLSLLVGGSILASSVESASTDVDGDEDSRLSAHISPSATTILVVLGANVAVFAAWRIPPLWRLLNRYMLVVPATPRPLSLLGAMFSQQQAKHLLANAIYLWFFGIRLHDEIGRPAFLQVYLSSGLVAFLVSLTNIVLRDKLHLTTLGASGAIYGIATAYFMLHKFEGFKILGLPPDPYTGIQGLGFIGLMLGLTLLANGQSIDVVSHLGGMAVGAAFGEYFRARKEEAARAEVDGRPARSVWELVFPPSTGTSQQSPAARP